MNAHLLIQFAIIFGVYLGGESISYFLPIPIPGNIIGMVALFILLLIKWVKLNHIEGLGKFLINNMAFFFIPAGVSIVESVELIKNDIIPILIICVLSTIITFIATALTAKGIITLQEKRRHK
nr:CidA/LrgA family protein [uncultured Niameybacter sp.]